MLLHLYLVRHGQTYFNRYNRLQGWSNSPLTDSGISDAHKAGEIVKNISFSAAFCSDTGRAQKTAEEILLMNSAKNSVSSSQIVSAMEFREQFYGYFEGQDMAMTWYAAGAPHGVKTFNQIVDQYGIDSTKNFLKQIDPFHDAENDEEYWNRQKRGFSIIAHDKRLRENNNVLLISHGNTLLSLMHRFADSSFDLTQRPENGSVSIFDFDTSKDFDQCLTIKSYNQK